MPAAFFGHVPGAHRKYSGCFWGDGVQSLSADDAAALGMTVRARRPAPRPMPLATVLVNGLAQRMRAAIARPFALSGHEFHLTASIGISVFPTDGDDEHVLMKNADIAMYQAKSDGKNTFAFYSAALNTHSVERVAFEARSSSMHAETWA